jgi:hypothetical protein
MKKAEEAAAAIVGGKLLPLKEGPGLISRIVNQSTLYKNISEWDKNLR